MLQLFFLTATYSASNSGSISPNTTPALTPVSAAIDNLTTSANSKSPTPVSSATPDHLSALESIKALNTGGSLQSSQKSASSSINQSHPGNPGLPSPGLNLDTGERTLNNAGTIPKLFRSHINFFINF